MDSAKLTDDDQIHQRLLLPYIDSLSDVIKRRFSDKTTKMCNSLFIFEPCTVAGSDDGCASQLLNLAALHKDLSTADLKDEWKHFRNFLQVQSTKKECPSGKDILQKLATKNEDLAATFPILSQIVQTILVCPLGTAIV